MTEKGVEFKGRSRHNQNHHNCQNPQNCCLFVLYFVGQIAEQFSEPFPSLSYPSTPSASKIIRMSRVEFKGGSLHDGFGGYGDSVESTLPPFCRSYKIQDKEATIWAVMAVSVVTAAPLNSTSLFRHPERFPRCFWRVSEFHSDIPSGLGASNISHPSSRASPSLTL